MATIKRGTTPVLAIKLGIDDLSDIATVDFLFKSKMLESDTTQVLKSYPTDASVTLDNGVFYVEFDEDDTRTFGGNTIAYLDVRPTTTSGKILATKIVPIDVYLTLYAEEEDNAENN